MSSPASRRRRWSALALIVTAQFMVVLDVAIVNVALPSIGADLDFARTSLQWVLSAYAILFGGTLLLGGRLADLLGRRRLFVAGLAVFTAGSLLCGLAWSEASLIAFRGLQGVGGALLAPAALSLLAGSAAPLLGFVAIERRSPAPLLPLRLLRLRTLVAANATIAIVGAVAFAEFFLLTLYLQEVLRYSAVESGLAFAAFAGMSVVASNAAQAVVGAAGVRRTLTAGLVLSLASVALLARLPVDGDYLRDVLPGFLLGGAGIGLSIVPLTIASLTGVQRADAGIASGLVNTSRQIGGAIGIAATSAIAATSTSRYADAHPALAATGTALDHGLRSGLYVLAGLLAVATLLGGALVRSAPAPAPARQQPELEPLPLEEAA